ncbi:hypothetical protein N9994_00365 [bacterium]|nr:hypothetical protein [bacterium]
MGQKQFLGNKASYGGFQYKWKPDTNISKSKKPSGLEASVGGYGGKVTSSGKIIYYVIDGYVG